VKVGTPFVEHPFEFRRLERRGRDVVVVGTVFGLESSLLVEPEDLRALARWVGPPLAATACMALYLRSR
jgi:hypothetical protein